MQTPIKDFGTSQGNDSDTGFFSALSPAEARKQFHVSLAVAAVMAASALLVLAIGVTPRAHAAKEIVKLKIEMPGHVTVHQANAGSRRLGG